MSANQKISDKSLPANREISGGNMKKYIKIVINFFFNFKNLLFKKSHKLF